MVFELNVNPQGPEFAGLNALNVHAIQHAGDQQLAALGLLNEFFQGEKDRKDRREDITMQFEMERELLQERESAKTQREMIGQMLDQQVEQQKRANFQGATMELNQARGDLLKETSSPFNELDPRFNTFADLTKKEFTELLKLNAPNMTPPKVSALFDTLHGNAKITYIDERGYSDLASGVQSRYGQDSLDAFDTFERAYPLGEGEAKEKALQQAARLMGLGPNEGSIDQIGAALARLLERRAESDLPPERENIGVQPLNQPQQIAPREPAPPLRPQDTIGVTKDNATVVEHMEMAESPPEPVQATRLTEIFDDFSFGAPDSGSHASAYVQDVLKRGVVLVPQFNDVEKDQVQWISVGTRDQSVPRDVLDKLETRINRDAATQAAVIGLMMKQGKGATLKELQQFGGTRQYGRKTTAPPEGANVSPNAQSILSGGGLLKYKQ